MNTRFRSIRTTLQSTARLLAGLFVLLFALPGCHPTTAATAPPTPRTPTTKSTSKSTITATPSAPSSTGAEINPVLATYKPAQWPFVSGPTNQPRVALTFDAGADATAVPLLLKTLAEHHVHCTFFLTGMFCKHFPAQCKAIADAGMELGNHSYDHPMFTQKSDKEVCAEVEKAEKEIIATCGRSPKPLFRFPYGDSNRRVRDLVVSEGYQSIHWTLDSLDSVGKPKDADFVANRIIAKIKPGNITLMHVSRVESARSLPRIFDYLDKQGIQVVPVSQLLLSQKKKK